MKFNLSPTMHRFKLNLNLNRKFNKFHLQLTSLTKDYVTG